MNTSFLIVPFCIYHLNDEKTGINLGYIGNPVRTKHNHTFKCSLNPGLKHANWKFYGNFYAVTPMLRPIPSGLKLLNVVNIQQYPYNTSKLDYIYDPYHLTKHGVSFMTWTRPAPYTVPLYIYDTPNGSIFPSFDKNPFGKNWKQSLVSPIFVLVDPKSPYGTNKIHKVKDDFSRDINGNIEFKFINHYKRCIPNPEGTSLPQCFLAADKNILGKEINDHPAPPTLLQTIQGLKDQNKPKNIFKNIQPIFIMIFIIIFLLSLISSIIILSK